MPKFLPDLRRSHARGPRTICLLLASALLLASCGQSSQAPATPSAVVIGQAASPTAEPNATIEASATPEPSLTAEAGATPEPSATPQPSPTSEASPTPEASPTQLLVAAVTVTHESVPNVSAPATPEATAVESEPSAPTPSQAGSAEAPAELIYFFPIPDARVDYGPAHHDYPAADMFCAVGSKFVAPTSGVIDYVSYEDIWNPAKDVPADRGGISVAIVGDDGVRYYGSHLSAVAEGIAVGVRVEAGQLLGLTGKSGNARSTPPHLHFGISRPTTADDWQVRRGEIPPYNYLKAWERGEQVRPDIGD